MLTNDQVEMVCDAIRDCFSRDILDGRDSESITEVMALLAKSTDNEGLRDAICRPAAPWPTPHGGVVGDLTEAMCYVGTAIDSVASSLDRIAEAIEQHGEE